MDRRSKSVSGWVNFPVSDNRYEHTNEGGMVVKLVVLDNRDPDQAFPKCFGAEISEIYTETVVGSDQGFQSGDYFPHIYSDDMISDLTRNASIPSLAVLTLGTTGWSGYSKEEGNYWLCTFDDLTEDGKDLYRKIEALYAGCKLHLLTVLDT